jgi:hypothetical protein
MLAFHGWKEDFTQQEDRWLLLQQDVGTFIVN